MNAGCFEKVKDTISAVSKKYEETYVVDDSKLQELEKACKIIDRLYEEFDGKVIKASVYESTMTLVVYLQCEEMILENGRSHPFFSLICMADTFRFSKADEDILQVDFEFRNLWRSRDEVTV